MPLTTITVTGSYPAGAGNSVAIGFVTFVPTARILNAAGHTIIPQLPVQVTLQLGAFSLGNVITTDNAGLLPTGWAWQVTENIDGVAAEPYYVYIPSSYGATVDLAELAEATPGPIITAYANLAAANTFTAPNAFSDGVTVTGSLELDGTAIAAPPGGTTEFLRADGAWDVPAGSGGGVQIGTDLGGTDDAPEVIATHLTNPLPTAQGGTGAGSLSAAGIVTTSGAATTVQAGTAYGTGSAVGTDTTYAREDHQHGTPALTSSAPATTEGIGQPAAVGTAISPARADHVHPLAAAGTPGSSAVGDTASTGVSTEFAASDHRHGRESFGAVTAQTGYGAASGTGTATTVAHSDHAHGTPALTTTAPAATLAIGTAAALGSATLPALADHVHPMAAAATPTNSAVTDAAATGNATTYSASNHVHGREGFGAVTALAAFNTASATGTAATVSHSDHVHGVPTLPAATTSGAGIVQVDGTATDIQALGAQAAGASGLAADAKHVHPTTGLVLASSLPLATGSGGTGGASAQAGMNNLAGAVTSGDYLRGNGTNVILSTIQAADLPAATTSTQGAVLATQTVVGAPTGTYATDVATINTAITAAGTYGTLYFPYNSTAYNVDGLAPLAGQTWYGQATLKRPTASTASVITATGVSNVTLRGLTVDGNSASSATSNAAIYLINTTWTVLQNLTVQNCPTGNAGIILRGSVRGLVDACQITGVGYGVLIGLNHGDAYSCYGNAIRGCLIDTTVNDAIFISENLGSTGSVTVVGSVYGTVVTGCTVRNFGDCGVEVGSGSVYTQVSGCSFVGISNASGNNGVLFRDAAHASVTGCTVSNLTKTGSTGVYCVNLNGTCSFIDITDVNVYNVGYGIIAVGGTSPTSLGTAANNICVAGGTVNVTSADGIQMTNVAGFSITGTQVYAAGNQGISVGKFNTSGSGSTDGTITGCRVMNSGQATAGSYSGIVLFQASADVAISNCRVGDNQGASKTQGYGIRIFDSTVTNVKITNCDVTNGGTVVNLSNASSAANGIEVYTTTGISPVGLRTAVTRPDANYDAPDHGLIAWSYDAALAAISSSVPVGGALYLVGVQARLPFTTAKAYLDFATTTTPGGVTAGANWIGLYDSTGTLRASAALDTFLTSFSAGLQTISWSAAYTGTPGQYWVGLVMNCTTYPTIYRAGSPPGGSSINAGITTAANYRACMNGTGVTTLANITPSSNSLSAGDTPRLWWTAIG